MLRNIRIVLLVPIFFFFTTTVFALPIADAKNTCEVSGGQWTETSSGNWACCWADWGCYGCVNGVCKIKCHNERCRKANSIRRHGSGVKPVKGLAPTGGKDPIVPIGKK